MPCMQSLPGACAALRPINHRKDRLAGFRAVVCDPKLPSAKGSSRPILLKKSEFQAVRRRRWPSFQNLVTTLRGFQVLH